MSWNYNDQIFRQAALRGLVEGANIFRNEMIRLIMRTAKTGRVYGNHQASAPGEAPASDIGDLVRSITPPQADNVRLAVEVVVASAHAGHLEDGTKNMGARPFARPATVNSTQKIHAAVFDELKRAGFGLKGGITHIRAKRG